jgi:pimeloyl-ACP methyl ester carboxylesterase
MLDRDTYYIYFDALARRYAIANDSGGIDLRSQLTRVRAPSLILGGRHDLVTPLSHSDDLAKGLPYSRLFVMQHSGHFPQFEEGYLFTQFVRRFMTDTSDQSGDVQVIGVRPPPADR